MIVAAVASELRNDPFLLTRVADHGRRKRIIAFRFTNQSAVGPRSPLDALVLSVVNPTPIAVLHVWIPE